MRNYSTLFLSGSIIIFFALTISSCKDDPEPFVKPKLSFSESTRTVNEDDGTIEVEVTLDKAATEDVIITYELDGSAVDDVFATANQLSSDYEITSDYLEIAIKKGEDKGIIEINLLSDFSFEGTETINIAIINSDSENIEITRDDEINILVQQEDGLGILLQWPSPDEPLDSLADMDLVLRVGSSTTAWDGIAAISADEAFSGDEFIFIPKTSNFAAYGLSYVYYEGTFKNLLFETTFIDFANGAFEPEAQRTSYNATYSAANKNKWTSASTTLVVQTFGKTGTSFTTPTAITVPATGSRTISSDNFTCSLKKTKRTPEESAQLNSIINKLGKN